MDQEILKVFFDDVRCAVVVHFSAWSAVETAELSANGMLGGGGCRWKTGTTGQKRLRSKATVGVTLINPSRRIANKMQQCIKIYYFMFI